MLVSDKAACSRFAKILDIPSTSRTLLAHTFSIETTARYFPWGIVCCWWLLCWEGHGGGDLALLYSLLLFLPPLLLPEVDLVEWAVVMVFLGGCSLPLLSVSGRDFFVLPPPHGFARLCCLLWVSILFIKAPLFTSVLKTQ